MLWEGGIAYTDKISGMFSQADTQTPPEQNATLEDLVLCLLSIERRYVPAFGLINLVKDVMRQHAEDEIQPEIGRSEESVQ